MSDSDKYTTMTLSRKDGGIVTVTLSRPELHNAFNETLIAELSNTFDKLGGDPNVRVIILTGEGKSFCAGGDIKWMRSMVGYSHDENIKDSQNLADMFKIINGCPKPVVGKINGSAIGGGAGLVAVCDVAIADENAKFSFSEVKLGIIPAVVSPYVLSKIGPGSARQLFITGERFDAQTALKIGLIHRTAPETELEQAVWETTELLTANGPEAMAEVKLLVAKWFELNPEDFRKYNVDKIAELRVSAEGKDGLEAFLEKRQPSWRRS